MITGTLSGMSRQEAESAVKRLGGAKWFGESKHRRLWWQGPLPGSKLQKALDLGVPVLDEELL